MYEFLLIWDWITFAIRWLHVITAMAWIGTSFYFIALDLGLRSSKSLPPGVGGEEWQVHGGGFYHIQKYFVAPKNMPEHLVWFKWESYATWLSGFALLMVMYWAGAEMYLIDRSKVDLSVWSAIMISALSLAVGWLIYDFLCKSTLRNTPNSLMFLLFVLLVFMAWGYDQVFTGRAALLHLGAFTATIMTANVFFIIMPNQRIVVADLKSGRTPNSIYGETAKIRSTHNNYLTLPVIFLMLSNHYPLAFSSQFNWLIAGLIFLMGVTIRHYFNTIHSKTGNPIWTWFATGVLFVLVVWLSTFSQLDNFTEENKLSERQQLLLKNANFEKVHEIIVGRCSMCHAREPVYPGIRFAPKNVYLQTETDIAIMANAIYLHSAISDAMPPGNVTWMELAERHIVREWYHSTFEKMTIGNILE